MADDGELGRIHRAMRELRPRVDADAFVTRVRRQHERAGYEIVYVDAGGEVVAAAGFRESENLAWGRFVYVDDLVTREDARRRGHADRIFRWLVEEASRRGCEELHLDSGVGESRFDAHRFYLGHGMDITSHHFARSLSPRR